MQAGKSVFRILCSAVMIFGQGHFVEARSWVIETGQETIDVDVERVALIRSYHSKPSEVKKRKVRDFYRTLPYSHVEQNDLKVRLFEVKAVSDGGGFWFGHFSSHGLKTSESLLGFLSLYFTEYSQCEGFAQQPSAVAQIVGTAPYESFGRVALGYADLVVYLSPGWITQNSNLDRPIYTRSCLNSRFDLVQQEAFFVDPTPGQGPDRSAYFVVIDRVSAEM